jgi:dienelactone hydrolase
MAFLVIALVGLEIAAGYSPGRFDLTEQIRGLDTRVLSDVDGKAPREMVAADLRARRRAANDRSSGEWRAIKGRAEWEAFRKIKLDALRRSLGTFPALGAELKTRVTGRLVGDGYQIENVLFESRPGLWVTANLYLPGKPTERMPGILICHSHHNPKTEGELQDMGMTWARAGCAVLVMDQVGHGERRQHPFRTAKDYAAPFPVGRQDYFFRYNVGMQLHLVGESLIGWMAGDLMRGVDLLLTRPDIDREKIILLGAVAGGGDPAAVTAALDERITAAVPFNFGGPQPETRYPLPDDAETTFNYAGGGSWESTRNLRLSASEGFLPWAIVGSIAPRRLCYAHEFSWDRERDPVWKRLEQVYKWYDVPGNLSFTHGRGLLSGRPPEATHCNNIGAVHRERIHEALANWFGIATSAAKEFRARRSADELRCFSDPLTADLRPKLVHEFAGELASLRMAAARANRAAMRPDERRVRLREQLARLLGDIEVPTNPAVSAKRVGEPVRLGSAVCERIVLEVEPTIRVPLVVLTPDGGEKKPRPVVVAFAQAGKEQWLQARSAAVAELLAGGIAVCCADLRGMGETRVGDSRDRTSQATALAAEELMLGRTMVGSQLRDLRSVIQYLGTRAEIDRRRIAVWGDSLADVNPPGEDLKVPYQADRSPRLSEPTPAFLALLAALYEDNIAAVSACGGVHAYQSMLDSPFCCFPADAVVPGLLTIADVADIVAAIAPRSVRLERLADGQNRRVAAKLVAETFASAQAAYRDPDADAFILPSDAVAGGSAEKWLIRQLGRSPVVAAERLLTDRLHHLRAGAVREWSEFPIQAEATELKLRFQAPANKAEATLSLRQQDVKQVWKVRVNKVDVGRLIQDENDTVICLPIPPGALRVGDNELSIEPASRLPDDIRVGQITLDNRPVKSVLTEASVKISVVDVTDAAAPTPVPCRITVTNAAGALVATSAASNDHLAVRAGVIYTSRGEAEFGLPAGEYTIYAGRGFEYGIDSVRLSLKPGDRVERRLQIRREVPTDGYVSCDTHIHTLTYSGHGDATIDERVITIAGEGIELPIATEHNRQMDYEAAARKMGVRRHFTPVVGNEVTTSLGHFNIFPVPTGGTVPKSDLKDGPAILDGIERARAPVVILNHARDIHSGFRPFGPERHNRATGENTAGWLMRAGAMEVVNSGAQQTDPLQLLHDWLGLLNRGHFLTPVGASDSHDVSRFIVGQGRTYIRSSATDPGKISVEQAVKNFLAGKVLVSCGLVCEITVNGKYGPGELAPRAEEAEVSVRVLGPSWVTADRVTLSANGREIQQAEIADGNKAGVKWAGVWKLPSRKHDVHLVAIATGPPVRKLYWPIAKPYQPMSPDLRGQKVVGATGAVWVDFDDDGKRTSAYEYARKLWETSNHDPRKFVPSLADYDEAASIQAAGLLTAIGNSIDDADLQTAAKKAGPHVERGFRQYLEARREMQIAAQALPPPTPKK